MVFRWPAVRYERPGRRRPVVFTLSIPKAIQEKALQLKQTGCKEWNLATATDNCLDTSPFPFTTHGQMAVLGAKHPHWTSAKTKVWLRTQPSNVVNPMINHLQHHNFYALFSPSPNARFVIGLPTLSIINHCHGMPPAWSQLPGRQSSSSSKNGAVQTSQLWSRSPVKWHQLTSPVLSTELWHLWLW